MLDAEFMIDDRILQASVLIVDDQQDNVDLLLRVLRSAGYRNLSTTTDSRKVVDIYQREDPDLVILDLMMPHLDGFGVMEALMREVSLEFLPVIVLTADHERETRIRALKSGARDFLTKPIDRVEVQTRIKNMLEMRLLYKDVRAQNEILDQKVKERTQELHDSRLEIVQRLARAAEFRDSDTGLHVVRMSQYSAVLGRAAGLKSDECDILLNAAALHDVGKIGIPDRVLLKKAGLTDDELSIMRNHVRIGAEILSGSRYHLMQWANEISLTHHEWFDGSGYPEGLKGDEIPLVGRIVAICDVFDALTSERPYKKGWTVEAAIAEIEKESGTHFDPYLVDLFQGCVDEMLQIRDNLADKFSVSSACVTSGLPICKDT